MCCWFVNGVDCATHCLRTSAETREGFGSRLPLHLPSGWSAPVHWWPTLMTTRGVAPVRLPTECRRMDMLLPLVG